MITLWRSLRRQVALRRIRQRFPLSELHGGVVVSNDSTVGEYVVLFPDVALLSATVGRFSYVQASTMILNAEVGPFCSIAANVTIGLAAHPTSMVSTSPVFYDPEQPLPRFLVTARRYTQNLPRTFIGPDVWIGQGAMLKAGIRVGEGAVIGAGAIVTRDVLPYEITAGSPSRRVRMRFPEDVAAQLSASRWWELDEATLRSLTDAFMEPAILLSVLRARGIRP